MDEFDKSFNRAQKFMYVAWVFGALLSCAVISGIGFVVYKLLVHFGVM